MLGGHGEPDDLAKDNIISLLRSDLESGREQYLQDGELSYRHYFVYRPGAYTVEEIRKTSKDFDDLILFVEWKKQTDNSQAAEEFDIVNTLRKILTMAKD